jgi:hypothetical protein
VKGVAATVVGFAAAAVSAAVALSAPPAAHRALGWLPVWSPDRSQIAWAERAGQFEDIWVASSDGSRARRVAAGIDSLGRIAWLPGNQLLYDADFQFFRLPLKSPRPRPVFFTTYPVNDFTTTADGRVVAWDASPGCRSCGGPIHVAMSSGGTPLAIGGETNIANRSASLSPDGQRVAFDRSLVDYGSNLGIWVSSTKGGPLTRLTQNGICPSWSPDGRWVAYGDVSSNPFSYSSLHLVAPDGGSNTLLLDGGDRAYFCLGRDTWSPSSRYVAVIDALRRLTIIDVATHRARPIFGGSVLEPPLAGFVWSPDSRTLVVATRAPKLCTLWRVHASGPPRPLQLGRCTF